MNPGGAATRRSAWIISGPWDLACIIATPLAIVPLVLYLASGPFTTAQITLFVLAFASIGHHVPGFLRAYGERELFVRYRWRFLLAPPLALALAFVFAWRQMPALQLVLLLWATWHIGMQTYGLLRIYGLKHGETGLRAARLDWLLCGAIFTAGYAFSDNRVFTLVDVLWQSGLPMFERSWLLGGRVVIGLLTGGIVAAYVGHLAAVKISGGRLCWPKLLLIVSTAVFYWVSGWATTDLLLGVAMFEVFHAVQYFAVTWAYQQRRRQRAAQSAGGLITVVQRNKHLAAYALLILLFGGLRYALGTPVDAVFLSVVTAVYAASALLHFYYDGFIWKVSERPAQANLDITAPTSPAAVSLSTLRQGATAIAWAGATALLLLLAFRAPGADRAAVDLQLAHLLPNVPEAQARAHHAALKAGDAATAIVLARREVALRPQWESAHAELGTALLADRQYEAAAASLEEAIRLNATLWQNHFDLAVCYAAQGLYEKSELAFARAAVLDPENAGIQTAWGAMCARRGDTVGAVEHYRLAQALAPQSAAGRANLATANLNQGVARQMAGDYTRAAASYRECLNWAPDSADAQLKLGEVLHEQGDWDAASVAYTRVIELRPTQAAAYYNLGLIKWQRGEIAAARALILRARELGVEPSSQVAHALVL